MKKILVVDDSSAIRKMVDYHLAQEQKYEILMVENGELAVEKVMKELPDLVLMDLMMPKMDGITATREIRKNPDCDTMPIVLLSAVGNKTKWVEALKAGANDFIAKPYEKAELIARIDTHLKVSGLTQELALKNRLLEKEKELAHKVQESILPQNLKFDGLELETIYQPSDQIGGDFFDAWKNNEMFHFLVGDVSGHGTAAALLMAAIKGIFQSLGQTLSDPLKTVTAVNSLLCKMAGDSGMFLTLVFVSFEKEKNELQIISAGHNPVFLKNGQTFQAIESTGPALGWSTDDRWDVISSPFASGDRLFLYTDGLTEAQNKVGEFYGEERLLKFLEENNSSETIGQKTFQELSSFCGGKFNDDLTIFAIQRK